MTSYNPFHVGSTDTSEQRSATDVFKSAAKPAEDSIKSRFASSGKFTTEQLEAGNDVEEPAAEELQFDPDDKRSLYERLQAQKDAKEEDFQFKSQFKNQMDHWRLDEDDAAFEDERRQKQMQQQREAARVHEEGAEFYKLARASQETVRKPVLAAAPPSAWESRGCGEKRKPVPKSVPAFKVLKAQQPTADTLSCAQPSPAPNPAATLATSTVDVNQGTKDGGGSSGGGGGGSGGGGGGGLPGMALYGDDDDDDDDE